MWVFKKAKPRKASYRYDDHNAAGDLDVSLMATPMKRRRMEKVFLHKECKIGITSVAGNASIAFLCGGHLRPRTYTLP